MQAIHSEISIKLDDGTAPDGCIVDADSAKLAQVIRSLVAEAFKYSPTGGHVNVMMSLVKGTNRVRVTVRDSGPSLSRDSRERMFRDATQRVFNPDELQGGQGAGMAMYLSRHIMDMHGGSIGVDLDWDGPGSIFYLELPISDKPVMNVRGD